MRVLLFSFISCFLIISCKPASPDNATNGEGMSQELKAMEDQVMAVHDEVMPKMKDINDISAQLRAIKATLKASPTGKVEPPAGMEEVLESLKLAEQGMWDWMKAYSDAKPKLKEDELKSFYQKELESITKVKGDMLTSIDNAKAWLAAHPK